jgi:hypothetical protein
VPKRRRALVLFAALAIAGLAASGCGSSAAAVRVGDDYVSQSDFQDQLDAVYENESLRIVLFGPQVTPDQLRGEDDPPGSYRQPFVGGMATAQVQFMVIGDLVEEEGLEITDADRDAYVGDLEAQAEQAGLDFAGAFDDLPGDMRDQLLDALLGTELLVGEFGEAELASTVDEAVGEADVSVSSRYGSWDPERRAVVPPTGPATPPGADLGGVTLE